MQRRRDARGAVPPVVAGNREALQLERVGEVDQVLTDRCLLRHPRSRGIAEARRTVAAKVRNQHAVAAVDEQRHDAVERAHVIGEPVQEHDWKALRIAAFLEPDAQHRCVDGAHSRGIGGRARLLRTRRQHASAAREDAHRQGGLE